MFEAAAFIGLDLGTSGCRALAIDAAEQVLAQTETALPASLRPAPGQVEQDPALWWSATLDVLKRLAHALGRRRPAAIAVDGTSATLLLSDAAGRPVAPALMYDDCRARAAAARIAALAPSASAAQGPGSSLAKLLELARQVERPAPLLALHQADWISGCLRDDFCFSDWNNALKLGYDPRAQCWPDWVRRLLPDTLALPQVCAPGSTLGLIAPAVAAQIGFPRDTQIVAGTTDSTAAALAAGLDAPGDALTSLGSTLVVKIVSQQPFDRPEYGVYSHRYGAHWLVGGASNSGGGVLRQFFDDRTLTELSARIDPNRPSGLDYYPLPGTGERFPRNDPDLTPQLDPRPADSVQFLHGLLEGVARIESECYARLAEIGAPAPRRVLTIGGGASNPTWTQMRQRILGIETRAAAQQAAAYGAALLARRAMGSIDCCDAGA